HTRRREPRRRPRPPRRSVVRSSCPRPPAQLRCVAQHQPATPAGLHELRSLRPPGTTLATSTPNDVEIKRASDQTPGHNTPDGPITGNRGGPMLLAESSPGGPMLLAGDMFTAAGGVVLLGCCCPGLLVVVMKPERPPLDED